MLYPSVSTKYEQMHSGLRKYRRDGRSITVVSPWVLNYTNLNLGVKTFLMLSWETWLTGRAQNGDVQFVVV